MYINNQGHLTKMAAMPIYGINPSKIFSGTGGPISKKLGVKHLWLKYYNVYINHDPVMTCINHYPVMTLTQFMARSIWVGHSFKWGKLLKCHLKGKLPAGNWQILIILKKKKFPRGFICPCTGVKYHNIQTCLLVYAADLR